MVNSANDRGSNSRILTASSAEITVDTLATLPTAAFCAGTVPAGAGLRPVRRVRTLGHRIEDRSVRHDLLVIDASGGTPVGTASDILGRLASNGAAGAILDGAAYDDIGAWQSAASDAGLALFVAPDQGALEAFRVEALEAILEHRGEMLRREDEVHRILVRIVLDGGSLAELAEALGDFFDAAALVTTTDGRVVASSPGGDLLDAARALDCFDRTGRLIVETEPVGVRSSGDARVRRALVKIVVGTSDHGILAVFSPRRSFTAADVHMLERAAAVAALAITKEQAVAAVEGKYRSEFLRDALAGRAGAPEEANSHARSLGWDIARRMVVVVAETDEDDSTSTRSPEEVRALQERFVRAWLTAVRTRDATIPVTGFSQEVVTLWPVPEKADTDAIMRSVADVARIVRGDGGGGRRTFSTGVSRPVASVADLPAAYAEALQSVTVGRQVQGESAMTHFDGLGIYRLLALIPDGADLRRFVTEALGDLADKESSEAADLRRTLSVLLDTNLNVAETARIMFFHYNTLRYRIAKLEKMLGPFTSDPQLRLTLALALRIHEMRGI